ncbi:MAG TPA: UDP-N-acetylmuramate--L-alanine ligase [Actinomycetes bacterium]|nr:UDP-N-acetylmuramate--L-alanine ligase [Actinomycetes bacterium]
MTAGAPTAGWLRRPRTIHLIGVGGAGMSGLARLALAAGHKVTGSDAAGSPTLDALRALGADVWVGHDAARLGRPELVAVSTAVRPANPELVRARELQIPVVRRARLLALLMHGKSGIAVAGTHGKTTTTTMVTLILQAAGLAPSFAIGGDLLGRGVNAGTGTGPHFVAEADESDGSFLELDPAVAVVTNVEADHLDHYGTLDAVQAAFAEFAARLPADGTLVVCADDPGASALAGVARCAVVPYSLRPPGSGTARARLVALDVAAGGAGSAFTVCRDGRSLGRVELPQPGRHNVANALAATAAALAAGAGFDAVQAGLAGYGGVARRFQRRGTAGGVTVVDDYAHHPTELAATLAAARLGDWSRVVAVFQPHLYSRTRAFAGAFGGALAAADVAVVTDVYGAREDPVPGVSGRLVADAARRARPGLDVRYVPERAGLAAAVAALARPGDVVLTLGAGDVTALAGELLPLLGRRTR